MSNVLNSIDIQNTKELLPVTSVTERPLNQDLIENKLSQPSSENHTSVRSSFQPSIEKDKTQPPHQTGQPVGPVYDYPVGDDDINDDEGGDLSGLE